MTVKVLPTPELVAAAAADHIERALADIAGPATLGLAGGSTPQATYGQLVDRDIAWEEVTMWLSDERWVAHHHPESNVGMVRGALVDRVHGQLLAPNHAIGDPHAAAAAYETALSSAFLDRGAGKAPDLVMLGIGDDGHTASLFPGTEALDELGQLYVANWVEAKEAWRLTATFSLLRSAAEIMFIVTGQGKAKVLKQILEDGIDYPAQRVASTARRATWFVDESAAGCLTHDDRPPDQDLPTRRPGPT